ncbi:hypothetical protein SD70_02085 [Gordoniibacillus kamchatkensis]|uniref:DinB-like domain-containing protein n=1 Tax=Gordoniibacillus kamchatkensis TaxID=1590651 RepID=A0ABR5AMQ1_9BACL|nr:DinB family protein [Paenibacillus sp. VKM B-2647]KIL42317.1 hypothetical protein SD70_02085 [Paenibacillus sp. VKM B-2647]
MTDTKTVLSKFEQTVAHYERELERYDLEQLTRKPGEEEWSLGQMYMHLIRSSLFMQLANVDACRKEGLDSGAPVSGVPGTREAAVAASSAPGATAATAAGKTEQGAALFAMGSFPPEPVRVPPSPQYTPPQPESKDELAQGLRQVLARMRELEPALAHIPPERTRPHPRLGGLNAVEWFLLVEMHYRHHLLQKARLDAFLGMEPAAG